MSYSISTLLTRVLQDVFGENDPSRRRAAIDEIWTEDGVFYDPKTGVHRGRDKIDRIAGDTWTDRLLTGGSRGIGAAIAKRISALPFESRSSVANMRPPEMPTNTPTFAYVLSNE